MIQNVQFQTHLMVEHLEYFPWLCGKDGCGAVKFSQQKLEEHQLAHHGEECEVVLLVEQAWLNFLLLKLWEVIFVLKLNENISIIDS